jgi:thymidine kinase
VNIPELIIFTGPMFGSKTTNLLGAIDRYRYQNKNVITFKPKLDDRYAISKIVTHNGGSVDAHVIRHGNDIMEFVQNYPEKIDVIAVDEAFMIDEVANAVISLFRQGVTIIVSSLDLSATCNPFKEIEKMLPWATKIKKCPAVCTSCGQDAYYTYKKVKNLDEITVGGADLYEPRCWHHHDEISLTRDTDSD